MHKGFWSLILALLIIPQTNLFAQVNTIWTRNYAGPGDYITYSACVTSGEDGYIYIAGGEPRIGRNDSLSSDLFVIKYDPSGNLLWKTRYNGPANSHEVPRAIAADGFGNVFASGRSYGVDSNDNYVLIKYDNTGNELWVKRYFGVEQNISGNVNAGMVVDGSGNVYINNGYDTLIDNYCSLAKFSSDGQYKWSIPSDTNLSISNALILSSDGHIYVTGFRLSGNTCHLTTAKFDTLGEVLWLRKSWISYKSQGRQITIDENGNVYVLVDVNDGITGRIITYNGINGDILWAKSLSICPQAIALGKYNDIYLVGTYDPPSQDPYDIILLKYSQSGDSLWSVSFSDSVNSEDFSNDIIVNSNGEIIVTGSSAPYTTTEYRFVAAKYDTSGNLVWKVKDNAIRYYPANASIDNSDNIITSGRLMFYYPFSWAYTTKTNNSGQMQWTKTYEPNFGRDVVNALIVDSEEYVYITGTSACLGTGSAYQCATVKYDQDGNQIWVAEYSSGGSAYSNDLDVDSLGNVYIVGTAPKSGDGLDFLTIKYNANGDTTWTRYYNHVANSEDVALLVKLDNLGNVYVVGYTKDTTLYHYKDWLFLKYDNAGNLIWSKTEGTAGSEQPLDMNIDNDGNIIITGSYEGWPNYGYVTIKYDSLGNQIWAVPDTFGVYQKIGKVMAIDESCNVYITGYCYNKYKTVKYNKEGQKIWQAMYQGPVPSRPAIANNIAVDSSHNVYITGQCEINPENNDIVTIMYNPNGDTLWTARYIGKGGKDDIGYSIEVNNWGIYVTGITYSNDDTKADVITLKYNFDGDEVWNIKYNGSGNSYDCGSNMTIGPSHHIYVAGTSVVDTSLDDYLVIKYADAIVAVEEIQNRIPKSFFFSSFPNPFCSAAKIKYGLAKSCNVSLKIYNIAGQCVKTIVNGKQNAGIYEVNWDGKDNGDRKLPQGIYFIRMQADDYTATKKMVLVK